MSKTFYEILAEKDDENTYYIHSTADIHHPDMCQKVKLSLLPYEIKAFECESYKPLAKNNEMFPDEPNSPTYTIKVVTRYPLTKGFISTLAMDAHIHVSHLKITPDKALDPVNGPEEIKPDEAQKTAGTKRLGEFMRELQQDRKEREEMTWTRQVYESFFISHRGLENIVKKPLRNGYYVCETYTDDGKKFFKAQGPYLNRQEEHPYRDRYRPISPQVISESFTAGIYTVEVLIEDIERK